MVQREAFLYQCEILNVIFTTLWNILLNIYNLKSCYILGHPDVPFKHPSYIKRFHSYTQRFFESKTHTFDIVFFSFFTIFFSVIYITKLFLALTHNYVLKMLCRTQTSLCISFCAIYLWEYESSVRQKVLKKPAPNRNEK